MTCKYCGAFWPADRETGYDADDVCPDCADELELDAENAYEAPWYLDEVEDSADVEDC